MESGTGPAQFTRLQVILANSHRFIQAVMALEAGLFRVQPAPARPASRRSPTASMRRSTSWPAYLRGVPVQAGDLPDLREGHRALLHSGASNVERYNLVNVESDRITNSLNTLSVELIQWVGDAA